MRTDDEADDACTGKLDDGRTAADDGRTEGMMVNALLLLCTGTEVKSTGEDVAAGLLEEVIATTGVADDAEATEGVGVGVEVEVCAVEVGQLTTVGPVKVMSSKLTSELLEKLPAVQVKSTINLWVVLVAVHWPVTWVQALLADVSCPVAATLLLSAESM